MEQARRALEAVDLTHRADELALALSHGEQRQLEIAMCLATEPQLLLLDEPLAGMGAEESQKMIDLIGKLADASRNLAGRARHGRGVSIGRRCSPSWSTAKSLPPARPEEIRANREVQIAYLGSSDELP